MPDTPNDGSESLRVLLIAPSMEIVGGQSAQAAFLLGLLTGQPGLELGFQPINPPLPRSLRFIHSIKYLRTIVNAILYYIALVWRIPRFQLLHVFTPGLLSYYLWSVPALGLGKLFGKSVILNYRDGRAKEHLDRWPGAATTLRMADLIVSPSEYVVAVLASYGIDARCIPNPIEPRRYTYKKRRPLRPIFLTNRGLEPVYNVGCVVRAFAVIQRRYPDATLTVAHDGVSRAELEHLVRDIGLRNVNFLGSVPAARCPALYDAADIYMMSPNVDCMPASVLECFASGLPVITTAVGGIPYMVTHNQTGLLVPANDHEALASCAAQLLADPQLSEKLATNARRELERYGPDAIRAQWIQTYRELISRR